MKVLIVTLAVAVVVASAAVPPTQRSISGNQAECMLCNDAVELLNLWVTGDFAGAGLGLEFSKLCGLIFPKDAASQGYCSSFLGSTWTTLSQGITHETCQLCHMMKGGKTCPANTGAALTKCMKPTPTAALLAKTPAEVVTQSGLMCEMRDKMLADVPTMLFTSPLRDICMNVTGAMRARCHTAFNTQLPSVMKAAQLGITQMFKDVPLIGCAAPTSSAFEVAPVASDLTDGSDGCYWCWVGINTLNKLLDSPLVTKSLATELGKVCDGLTDNKLRSECQKELAATLDLIVSFITGFTDVACGCTNPSPPAAAFDAANPLTSAVGCQLVEPVVKAVPRHFAYFERVCAVMITDVDRAHCMTAFNTHLPQVIDTVQKIYPAIFNLKCDF